MRSFVFLLPFISRRNGRIVLFGTADILRLIESVILTFHFLWPTRFVMFLIMSTLHHTLCPSVWKRREHLRMVEVLHFLGENISISIIPIHLQILKKAVVIHIVLDILFVYPFIESLLILLANLLMFSVELVLETDLVLHRDVIILPVEFYSALHVVQGWVKREIRRPMYIFLLCTQVPFLSRFSILQFYLCPQYYTKSSLQEPQRGRKKGNFHFIRLKKHYKHLGKDYLFFHNVKVQIEIRKVLRKPYPHQQGIFKGGRFARKWFESLQWHSYFNAQAIQRNSTIVRSQLVNTKKLFCYFQGESGKTAFWQEIWPLSHSLISWDEDYGTRQK